MAVDDKKKENQMMLLGITLRGVAGGLWDMVGDGAYALCPSMGQEVLKVMEKEMGLEIHGENAEDVLNEIGRLFVDEFGFASRVDVQQEPDALTMRVHGCSLSAATAAMVADGVEPFVCPYRNSGFSALDRAGIKARPQVTFNPVDGCTIAFRMM